MRTLLLCLLLFFPQDDIDELVKKLGSSSYQEQGKAAKALEELGLKAVPALEKAAQGDNAQVRDWAETILQRIEATERKYFKALIDKLGSRDFEEQGKVADEILKTGARARKFLQEALKSENEEVRRWARKLLTAIDGKKELPDLGGSIEEGGRFESRFGAKGALVARGGGNKATEDAVLSALRWLARHQNADGGWGTRECGDPKCTGAADPAQDAGVTALALLAFLGAGYTHLSKDTYDEISFGDVVKKALVYLMAVQDKEGCVGGRGTKYLYNHAIATIALCEAFGMTGSKILKDPAQKAVDFLVAARNPGKAWRYSYRSGDNDTSVTAWCVAALRAAEVASLTFPKSAYEGALAWIEEVTEEKTWRVGYTHRGTGKVFVPGKNEMADDHPALTAAGVYCRIAVNRNKSEPALDGTKLLLADLPEWGGNKTDTYYWYLGSQALFHYDGPDGAAWKKWNEAVKNAIAGNQRRGKCSGGSWDPEGDRWAFEGGRVYATAINALTLETYYRYVSIFRKK